MDFSEMLIDILISKAGLTQILYEQKHLVDCLVDMCHFMWFNGPLQLSYVIDVPSMLIIEYCENSRWPQSEMIQ